MRSQPLKVVLLGECDPADLCEVDAALRRLPPSSRIDRIPQSLDKWPARAVQADLCIVLQSWPDEFPASLVQALVEGCLTGRLICCQGAWCASAGRTRSVWPQAVCVPIEQFAARLQLELEILGGVRAPLPFTAARDEVFAAVYAPGDSAAAVRLTVDSLDTVFARELTAALDRPVSSDDEALLLDVDPLAPTVARLQIEQRRAITSAPIIAVAGFPRADECGNLLSAGAAAVVSRLSPLTDLQSAITRARHRDRT